MFEQLPPELRIMRTVDQRPIEEQIEDIEEQISEIEGQIEECENQISRLESKHHKLEDRLSSDEEGKRRLAEKLQGEADERKQRELLKKRYGHPFARSISDYWFQ